MWGRSVNGYNVEMSVSSDRDLQRILNTFYHEKRKFSLLLPARFKTLDILLRENNPYIPLISGEKHYIDAEEIKELASLIPWYMHRYVELPFLFNYKRTAWGSVFILANKNARWNARALGIIFHGRLSVEKKKLLVDEIKILISRFKSLVFIGVEFEAI